MRAFLIDAEAKTVSEVQMQHDNESEGVKSDLELLDCDSIDGVTIDGDIFVFHHAVFVDDEGLLKEEDELEKNGPRVRGYFQIRTSNGWTPPLLGKGIVHGFGSKGETRDVRMTVEEMRGRVRFTRKRFLGMTSGVPESGPYDFVIAPMFGDGDA